MTPLLRSPLALVRAALAWPVATQEQARRNALVACTALAARCRDRELVEEFLERHARATRPAHDLDATRVI